MELLLTGTSENLQDHVLGKRTFRTTSKDTVNTIMRSPLRMMKTGLQYLLTRGGPLSSGAVLAGGYASSEPGLPAPDLQLFYCPFAPKAGVAELAEYDGFHMSVYQGRPESRGHVRIKSADPRDHPAITGNYLAAEKDRQTLIAGMRLLDRIAHSEPLAQFVAEETEPGIRDMSDDQLVDYFAQTAYTAWHHSGTCRMGQVELAVVDPTLRVRGIDRLRVADGSVMPTVVTANTNAACLMIGEKTADLIKAG